MLTDSFLRKSCCYARFTSTPTFWPGRIKNSTAAAKTFVLIYVCTPCSRHHLSAPTLNALRALHLGPTHLSDAIATPPLDGAPKQYPPKIQQLVNDIASLTLLEVSDLNELLKVWGEKTGIGIKEQWWLIIMPYSYVSEYAVFWFARQKTLNIQDVGMMPMGAMAAAPTATAAPVNFLWQSREMSFIYNSSEMLFIYNFSCIFIHLY